MRVIKYIAWAFAWLVALVCATWAFGALYFDFPEAGELVAILFVIVLVAAVIFLRGKRLKLAIVFAALSRFLAFNPERAAEGRLGGRGCYLRT